MDCAHPLTVKTDEGYKEVPCGSCILCRIARTREWSTRLQFENSCWKKSVFLTLTYDDEHIPVSNCGYPTLVKKDLQNFFKRLRSRLHEEAKHECDAQYPFLSGMDRQTKISSLERKFKYFGCGEYGDNTQRCHFHAIVFGLSPSDLSLIQSVWPSGFVSVGGVSPQSIQYVTGYVRKKVVKKSADPDDFGCLHRFPEFQIQSQGLGLRFYEKFRKVFWQNGSCYINGHRESLPRYFLKKDSELRNALKATERVCDTRSTNLKRAQSIINARGLGLCILDEQRSSAIHKARTEEAKNRLFVKGTV